MGHSLASKAAADLEDIWTHVALESGNAEIADRQLDAIAARFQRLARHPYLGRDRANDLRPGDRSFVAGNYVIIYCVVNEQDVEILRVVHGSRDLPNLLGLP